MLGGIETRKINGPSLTINCCACGLSDAVAISFQYGERATVLHVVPASPFTETNYVQCGNCGELFVSRISVFDLPNRSSEELSTLLIRRVGLVPLTLTVCGIVLFFVPVIGLIVSLLALMLTWRRRGHWSLKVSIVGALLSLPFTACGLALLAIGLLLH
jgi:hypothetical protein